MDHPIATGTPHQVDVSKLTRPERAFLAELQGRMAGGEILWWREHPFSLKLNDGSRYTPDFGAVLLDGVIELYEVKGTGGWKFTNWGRGGQATTTGGGASRVKFNAAVEEYPMFRFCTAFQRKKKDGGGFEVEAVTPRLGFSKGTTVPALKAT